MIEQSRLIAGSRIADLSEAAGLQPPPDRAVSDSNGFLLEWGGVCQFFLGDSQSRLYPHMRAKCGRGPTAVSLLPHYE